MVQCVNLEITFVFSLTPFCGDVRSCIFNYFYMSSTHVPWYQFFAILLATIRCVTVLPMKSIISNCNRISFVESLTDASNLFFTVH